MSEPQGSGTRDGVITVDSVDAGYGSVQILHQVSMTARTGEVTCIFGPNGCGKSTLLKAMAGVIDPWAGRVTLDDVQGNTLLTVAESGFDQLPQARRDEAYRMERRGWAQQLEHIQAYVKA